HRPIDGLGARDVGDQLGMVLDDGGGDVTRQPLGIELGGIATRGPGRGHQDERGGDELPTADHESPNASASSQEAPSATSWRYCMTCRGRFIPMTAVTRPLRP